MSSKHQLSQIEPIGSVSSPLTSPRCNALTSPRSSIQWKSDNKIAKLEETLMNDLIRSIEKKQQPSLNQQQLNSPSNRSSASLRCPPLLLHAMESNIQNKVTEVLDHNADYFSHIAGNCLCTKCSCGKHKCNYRSGLQQETMRSPKTNYQAAFDERSQQPTTIPPKGECPVGNIFVKKDQKFVGTTTNRDHYLPERHSQSVVEQPIRKEDNITSPRLLSTFATAYSDGYSNSIRGSVPVLPYIPRETYGVVIAGSPFASVSEAQAKYNKEHIRNALPAQKADISKHSKGVNFGFDQSKLPGFYSSSYQRQSSPEKPTLDKNSPSMFQSVKKLQIPSYRASVPYFIPSSSSKMGFVKPSLIVSQNVLQSERSN